MAELTHKERIQALEQIMGMDGWTVVSAYLTMQVNSDLASLASPKRELADDYLRGRISMAKYMLVDLPEEVRLFLLEKEPTQTEEQLLDEAVGHPYGPDGTEDNPLPEGV